MALSITSIMTRTSSNSGRSITKLECSTYYVLGFQATTSPTKFFFFFFIVPPPPEISPLPLPAALPISRCGVAAVARPRSAAASHHGRALHRRRLFRRPDPRPALDHVGRRGRRDGARRARPGARQDRKSTRLNSSHSQISYAVFCLKKQT